MRHHMSNDHNPEQQLVALAREWALEQEAYKLRSSVHHSAVGKSRDAKRVGVKNTAKVRVLAVDRIPMPENAQLAEAARRAQIITENTPAVTIGHGIMIRADRWHDRELLLHQLVHVAQCERSGGLHSFVEEYLTNRSTCADFTVGSLEDEARNLAREICAGDSRSLVSDPAD